MNAWKTVSLITVIALASACGGDDPATDLAGDRGAALDSLVARLEASGADVDEQCAAAVLGTISDEELAKMASSDEADSAANATALELMRCVEGFGSVPGPAPDVSIPDVSIPDVSIPDVSIPDVSIPEITAEVVDALVQSLESSGLNVDRDCIAAALHDLDPAEIASAQETGPSPEFIQRFIGCIAP